MNANLPTNSADPWLSGLPNSMCPNGSADLVSIAQILATKALELSSTDAFVAFAGEALAASPLEVARLFISLRALHPGLRARTHLWEQAKGRVRTIEWPHGLGNRPGYYDSPDYRVHMTGQALRVRRPGQGEMHTCDLYALLRSQGYTDYLIVPLRFSDGVINTLSIATTAARGFDDSLLRSFKRWVSFLAVALERYAARETLSVMLETYLGRGAGGEVLRGRVRAGDGELVDAAILMADIRDFIGHAARLDAGDTVRLLNSYFDCLVRPIEDHGGQVLKFIGDAVLAFFPVLTGTPLPAPLDAVREIRSRLAKLNGVRERATLPPIRHSLCAHFGRVVYGNIGSTDRLDFTIIGEAVNLVARGVEQAKVLGTDYLFTAHFVERFGGGGLTSTGTHVLRGIAEAIEMYSLPPTTG